MRDVAVAFRDRVIGPVVDTIGRSECNFVDTALAGAALRGGFSVCSSGNGHLSLYGLSSALHHSVWDDYLAYRPELASLVRGFASQRQFLLNPDQELDTNISYATAVATCLLHWKSPVLPYRLDPESLCRAWTECVDGKPRHDAHLCHAYRKVLRWFQACPAAA